MQNEGHMVHEEDRPTTPDDLTEKKHYFRVLNAFKKYRACSMSKINNTEKYLSELPVHHQRLLSDYKDHLRSVQDAVERNDLVIQRIIRNGGAGIFDFEADSDMEDVEIGPPTQNEFDKVQGILKLFVRDWSSSGRAERMACYQPIINTILEEFSHLNTPRSDVKVLVPGAGLGRLVYEIADNGFSCQGNEFSVFMLLASNFVLNCCRGSNLHTIYPYATQTINVLKAEDQLKQISFPDLDTSRHPLEAELSMAAGDFLDIYNESDQWDCVATCFFIDCAHNIVAFVETIYKILKPGGIWVNLGPLLYHFADMRNEQSIEPSYDMLRDIILKFGFFMEKEDTKVKTSYTQNPASMMKYEYESVFFVCRKPGGFTSPVSR